CLIVDDHPGFCEAARELLEVQGLTVVGCASSASEAVRCVRELRPEVALVDIDLGTDSGFDLARRLTDDVDGYSPRVILVSTHDELLHETRVDDGAAPAHALQRVEELVDIGHAAL